MTSKRTLPEIVQNVRPVKRLHIRMQILDENSFLLEKIGQILCHLLRKRRTSVRS